MRTAFALCGLLAAFALSAACGDQSSSPARCAPAAAGACATGQVCVAAGPDGPACRPGCDPAAAASSCGAGTVCVPLGAGGGACVPSCDPTDAGACGDGWRCAAAGGRGDVCRPDCDPAAPVCATGEVCQPLADGTGACLAECSPDDDLACPAAQLCERRTDGVHACYDPVRLAGRVFDLTTDAGIADGRVFAADAAGAAATDVAVTATDGTYALAVPVEREPDGTPATGGGTFTLRVGAQGYAPFPHGVRVALPIDAAALAVAGAGGWVVQNATTDVGLIPLPAATRERGSIAGRVLAADPGGTLIVANAGAPNPPIGWSDRSGAYVVFNADVGTYAVRGYKAHLQLATASTMVGEGAHVEGVDLAELAGTPTATVSGSINIVNGGDCSGTSVVLVPEETYDDTLQRGEVGTGLRAPDPGTPPSISGAFTIGGVPDGRYAVLAAFENDRCVRDPDPGIAGTQVVHITVPDGTSRTIALPGSFKVTGALAIDSPGASEPEAVAAPLTFRWADDSSEDAYDVVVYDAFGTEVWTTQIPGVSGGTPSVDYGGPALQSGMYYQFRVTSLRRGGTEPISMTEDLLGVFYLE